MMALFGKRFEKKGCAICGSEIEWLDNRKPGGKNYCKDCEAKLSPWFSNRRQTTVEEIKEQLAYREANKIRVAAFHITRILGEDTKVLLDEDAGLFMVTATRNLMEANPDVLALSDVTGCKLDINESEIEIEEKDAGGKRHGFNSRQYTCSYDFCIVINVSNPFFNEIRFKLNDSSAGNDTKTMPDEVEAMRPLRGSTRSGRAAKAIMGSARGGTPVSNEEELRAGVEYRRYEAMGLEIRDALLRRGAGTGKE